MADVTDTEETISKGMTPKWWRCWLSLLGAWLTAMSLSSLG